MRIETFSAEEITLEEIQENLMASLQASNESSTVTEITDDNMIPTHDTIENIPLIRSIRLMAKFQDMYLNAMG